MDELRNYSDIFTEKNSFSIAEFFQLKNEFFQLKNDSKIKQNVAE